MPEINFKPSLKQHIAWQYLEDGITTEAFYGGAAGGGKSYLGCYWKVYRRLRYPNSRGVTGRSVLKRIKESTLVTYLKVLGECGLKAGRDYRYNGAEYYIEFANGSRETFIELAYKPSDPDYQRLGSTEFTDAWIEEAGDSVPEKAFEVLQTRIRWKLHDYGIIPKMLITGNPGYYWARDRFVMDREGNPIELKPHQKYIHATVSDNPDKGFVKLYKSSLENLTNDYDKARLLHGDWNATERTGAEFYFNFNTQVHVKELGEVKPKLPLHLTFDFNRVPHMTLLIIQVEGKDIRVVDEICLKPPKSNTPATVKEFVRRYQSFEDMIFIYGDPSGKNGQTITEDERHNFSEARRILQEAKFSVRERLLRSAPSPAKRGEYINNIFAGKQDGLSITINHKCNDTIEDLLYLKTAPDGNKLKKRITDPKTGISYEPYGHETDALEYFICSAYASEYQKFLKGGRVGTSVATTGDYISKGY